MFSCFSLTASADENKTTVSKTKTNKDLSSVHITTERKENQILAKIYLSTKGKRRLVLSFTNSEEQESSPFFGVDLVDFDHDGYWDIEKTGVCGNKVCEKTIYRFNPNTKQFFKFFSGAYNSISLFDNYLIESGSSGCCSHEYHAYKIEDMNKLMKELPDYVITNNVVQSEVGGDSINCSFTNEKGEIVQPINKSWLRFCETYGRNYKLIDH
jgi:hypothetical protein